ncbi:hypothetical protein, partial [Heyndrickxia faecalis]
VKYSAVKFLIYILWHLILFSIYIIYKAAESETNEYLGDRVWPLYRTWNEMGDSQTKTAS